MKARDSGMPEEDYWNTFYDAECVVIKMFGGHGCEGSVVEFGSGYGTFTLPAARHATGTVFAFDIEPDLITRVRQKALDQSVQNIHAYVRDFVIDGTGLEPQTQSHAMIYNLLHVETPVELLEEAHRVLRPGGRLSVIHWRSDIPTPRGPALDIRPLPDQCKAWIAEAGFRLIQDVDLSECCQYHFGIVAVRR
jgi:ubiquinone/menaquinone biosynthesis C-methylase UbiE